MNVFRIGSWVRPALGAAALLLCAGPAAAQTPAALPNILGYLRQAALTDDAGNASQVRKWHGSMRVLVRSTSDDTAYYRAALERVLDQLLPIAGVLYSFGVPSGEPPRNGDLVIEFIDRNLVGELHTPNAICQASKAVGPGYVVRATLAISTRRNADAPEPDRTLVEGCLAHEILHALGFSGHPQAPSILARSISASARSITDADRLALYVLYDSRLAPGAVTPQATAQAASLSSELRDPSGRQAAENLIAGNRALQQSGAAEARRLWLLAAEQGSARALEQIGIAYLDGIGGPANVEEASRWLAVAAERGMPQAQWRLGDLLLAEKGTRLDGARAVALLQLAAGNGVVAAADRLARAYQNGEGVPADTAAAGRWYTHAGDAYFAGRGVLRSPSAAYEAYRLGAEVGYAAAQLSLASALARGAAGPADAAAVMSLYERALAGVTAGTPAYTELCAYRRCAEVQFDLGVHHLRGTGGLVRDDAVARIWMLRAAEDGHPMAAITLGTMLGSGVGGPADRAAAVGWVAKAVATDDPAVRRVIETFCQRVTCPPGEFDPALLMDAGPTP